MNIFFLSLSLIKISTMAGRSKLLASKKVQQMIERMVHEIIENFYDEKELTVIGISSMGSKLAKRIVDRLNEIKPFDVVYHEITVEKDAPLSAPVTFKPANPVLKKKNVLLIDDVLNSGRTMIYAASHILSYPVASLHTLSLVDRIHRRFPIKADIVGISLSTTIQEHVKVDLAKGKEAIYLE